MFGKLSKSEQSVESRFEGFQGKPIQTGGEQVIPSSGSAVRCDLSW